MSKRLSVKLAFYIMLILLLIVLGASLLYSQNAKDIYISNAKENMQSFVEQLNKIDIENQRDEINTFIDKHYDQTYHLYICDDELTPVYSTKRMMDATAVFKEKFVDKLDEYSAENEPVFEKQEGRYERIILKTKLKNNGNTYYVFVEESLRTSDAVFNYTNEFLTVILLVFIVITGVAVFVLITRTTKSLHELSNVATKLSQGDYSVRYNGKIANDEVGVLAKNLNFMADTIAENVNNLKNYNFLLKEDNSRMTEYENMRKRVLTNVTHELKTPLAIISSQIEMMTVTKDENKKNYYYASAMEEIDKMGKLISRLLNFSAGEKVIFETKKEIVDLDLFIDDICKKSEIIISSKNMMLDKDFQKCRIEATREHIDHIFNNYLMNALQHSKAGGRIKVSIKKYEDAVRLSVFNEGCNIDESDREKIWTDFYKSPTVSEDNNRTGIGLFIVKEISLINKDKCGFINHSNGVEFWYDFCE